MHNALSNARHPGEKFQDYKARLKLVGRKLKQYLRGQMAHISARGRHGTYVNEYRVEREGRSYWHKLRTERKARWAAVSPARA